MEFLHQDQNLDFAWNTIDATLWGRVASRAGVILARSAQYFFGEIFRCHLLLFTVVGCRAEKEMISKGG